MNNEVCGIRSALLGFGRTLSVLSLCLLLGGVALGGVSVMTLVFLPKSTVAVAEGKKKDPRGTILSAFAISGVMIALSAGSMACSAVVAAAAWKPKNA